MHSQLIEWFQVIFRFVHVIAGIMWIGNSLLFTWMELNLIKKDQDKDLLGELDMLHGGGVFHLEKRVLHADAIPERLHWFKWQSYTTWITGALLLAALFYVNGSSLLDSTRTDLTARWAVVLSVAGIVGGWVIYDLIWRSPLGKNMLLGIIASFAFLIAAAIAFGMIFNGRALFLQIGAMMGTFMSANVFFHIIKNQHRFMRTLKEGGNHDLQLAKNAKSRSLHNHYMTFPVIFLMLSAHFPALHAAENKVPILMVLIIALMAIKHLMNTRYYFRFWLVSCVGVFLLGAGLIAFFLNPPRSLETEASAQVDPQIAAGKQVFLAQGCAACHMQGSAQIAPELDGIWGSTQKLIDGSSVVVDEAYVIDSILKPHSQIVHGHAAAMPSYEGRLSDEQLKQIIAYLKSITK